MAVQVNYNPKYTQDFTDAAKALQQKYKLSDTELQAVLKGQTWHHTENASVSNGTFRGTLILVDSKIHTAFRHNGGRDIFNNWLATGTVVK
jgi:hypothetical protein